jgi:hypothetical protein
MAFVAPPHCGQRRVILLGLLLLLISTLVSCQAACFFTTRVVAFYASSNKLPVQKRQLLVVRGMFATEGEQFPRVSG